MDLATTERLLEPAGRALVEQAAGLAGTASDLAVGTRLRRDHDPDLVAAAVTQAHLRGRARTKLGDAGARMFWTHDALEQATRGRVAARRAERLVAAGVRSVVDLGCGVGADLVALARAGLGVHGVERDPVRALLARANLEALELAGTVEQGDAEDVDVEGFDAAFCDPARRSARGRTFDVDDFAPPWSFVEGLLAGRGVVKTLPGLGHDRVPDRVEAEWVCDDGDLVEACLWGSTFATASRRVTALPSGETLTDADLPASDVGTGPPGRYLYEPLDGVGRAGLVQALAGVVDGWLLDPHLAYVASDRLGSVRLARTFTVVEELPFRTKSLRAALVERDVGTLTVKKRGVDVVPERLVRSLRLRGSRPATVVMTRVEGDGRAFLVEPV